MEGQKLIQNISKANTNTNFGITYQKFGTQAHKIVDSSLEQRYLIRTAGRMARRDFKYQGKEIVSTGERHILTAPSGDTLVYYSKLGHDDELQAIQYRSERQNCQIMMAKNPDIKEPNGNLFDVVKDLIQKLYPQVNN